MTVSRSNLAADICASILHNYQGQVLIGGVYGSTSTHTDTSWSDLEMWFVVKDSCEARGRHFLYKDIPVGYRVYKRSELEEIVTNPSERWPFHMGVLSVLKLIFGDPKIISTWLEMGLSVPKSTFYSVLEEILPGLVFESHGRIHSSAIREDEYTLLPAIWEVLFEMLTALCLLNQRWVTHDYYQGLVESFEFPRIPKSYRRVVPALYTARSFDEAEPLADELVTDFILLLKEEGIHINNYQSLREIPI